MLTSSETAVDSPTVFVVDNDPAVRKALSWLIESVDLQVETYASALEFLDRYDSEKPGCLVLDVRMPGMSGLELQEKLHEMGIEIPVILVSGYADVPMAVRAMKNGAIYFLEKPVSDQILLDLIQQAISQDARQREERKARERVNDRVGSLTPREREVMQFVIAGKTSRQIGSQLGVTQKTVEAHRANIMKKMGVHSVPELVHMSLTRPESVS